MHECKPLEVGSVHLVKLRGSVGGERFAMKAGPDCLLIVYPRVPPLTVCS